MEGNKKAFGEGTQSWGYHEMRIPENEFRVLCVLLPDLDSKDTDVRKEAWTQFAKSNLADAYRIVRKPSTVKRSNNNRIIIK